MYDFTADQLRAALRNAEFLEAQVRNIVDRSGPHYAFQTAADIRRLHRLLDRVEADLKTLAATAGLDTNVPVSNLRRQLRTLASPAAVCVSAA
jgi:hypothetical protein